ncbi:major capsid protein [Microbacterium phage Curie]
MVTKTKPRRFKPFTNIEWLNAFRGKATDEYKARIPVLTQANYDATMRDMDNYIPGQNAILAALLNKVGLTKFNADQFENPMGEFIQGTLAYGESVEDVQLGFIQASSYDTDRETGEQIIFSRETIEMDSSYYEINRQDRYKVTLENLGGEIRKAFYTEDGLNSFLNAQMAALQTSAQFDEFLLMANLIQHYETMGGFYKVQVPDLKTGTPEQRKLAATTLLEGLREYAAEFAYPNRKFNASGLPTFAKADELVILVTPAGKAALDVQALATLFNIDKGDVPARIIMIPKDKWKIPGAQAILTTRRFFQIYNVLNTMTEQQNAAALYTNHFLHVHQIIAYSRFVPAVLFWTGPGTETEDIVWDVTGLGATTITDLDGVAVTEAKRGSVYELSTTAQGTGEGFNSEVGYVLAQPGSSNQTRVGMSGVLLIGYDETAESVEIERFAIADPEVRSVQSIPLTGTIYQDWPIQTIPDPGA